MEDLKKEVRDLKALVQDVKGLVRDFKDEVESVIGMSREVGQCNVLVDGRRGS